MIFGKDRRSKSPAGRSHFSAGIFQKLQSSESGEKQERIDSAGPGTMMFDRRQIKKE
jgi:hypothetical protein